MLHFSRALLLGKLMPLCYCLLFLTVMWWYCIGLLYTCPLAPFSALTRERGGSVSGGWTWKLRQQNWSPIEPGRGGRGVSECGKQVMRLPADWNGFLYATWESDLKLVWGMDQTFDPWRGYLRKLGEGWRSVYFTRNASLIVGLPLVVRYRKVCNGIYSTTKLTWLSPTRTWRNIT